MQSLVQFGAVLYEMVTIILKYVQMCYCGKVREKK